MKPKSIKYTKEKLIALCDAGIVPFEHWSNRDTPAAQANLATVRAYLLAGCDWRIRTVKTHPFTSCITDGQTVWVDIYHYEFEDDPAWHLFYLPTAERLKDAKGKDWY